MIRRGRKPQKLTIENLERRELLAGDICTASNAIPAEKSTDFASAVIRNIGTENELLDLNTDGVVSPMDGLLVSNAINNEQQQCDGNESDPQSRAITV